MRRLRQPLSPLSLLLGAFIILSLIYAWATPIFEASDELWHFGVVNHIANTGELPVQVIGVDTSWEQEGSQPPLYYGIAAVLVAPIDRSDFEAVRQPNPHNIAGVPGAVGNKNLVLHDTPHPPLQGTVLAVYVVRLFSIALGAVTVYAVYQCVVMRKQDRPSVALFVAGITAFNPMFLFITASANNDNLVIALNTLIIWQVLLIIRGGFSFQRSVLSAILIALASLTKLSALVLIPVVILAALWVARLRGDWRGFFILMGLIIALWLMFAGWWYLRNLTLYSELLGTQTMAAVAGKRVDVLTLNTLLSEFQGFRFGYWGVFGAFNIMTFRWFYDVVDSLTVLALLGLVLHLWYMRSNSPYLVPALLLGLIVTGGSIGVIGWTAQTYASQGRLLFPYVAASHYLLALGLLELGERFIGRPQRLTLQRFFIVPVFALGIFALIVPFASIAPEYAPPNPLTALPASARQVYARYGDVALVGYETPDQRYQPGDTVPITLYWQVLERSSRDLSLYLNAVIEDGEVIGKVDSYPGTGRLRTTTWQEGAIYPDTYAIPLDSTAAGQSILGVQVGWWHYPSQDVIEPVADDGAPLPSVLLDAGAFVGGGLQSMPGAMVEIERAQFGGLIALEGYHLEGNMLTLVWDSLGTPPANYTVFAQVLDAANTIVGQGDAPPQLPTRFWRAGEQFVTHYLIVYPEPPAPGTYRLVVGWYRPDNFERLLADYPDNAYPLTDITIEPP